MKRFTAIGGTVLALAAGGMLTASPAFAGTNVWAYTKYSGSIPASSGSVDFSHAGDNFRVCDNSSDGYGQRAWVKVNGRLQDFNLEFTGGKGKCGYYNRNYTEGAKVEVKICLMNDGMTLERTCSGWEEGEA